MVIFVRVLIEVYCDVYMWWVFEVEFKCYVNGYLFRLWVGLVLVDLLFVVKFIFVEIEVMGILCAIIIIG